MIGKPLPKRLIGNICTREPTPAIIIATCTKAPTCSVGIFTTPVTIKMGAILATNIASTCCNPKGIAFFTEIFPFNSYIGSFCTVTIYLLLEM